MLSDIFRLCTSLLSHLISYLLCICSSNNYLILNLIFCKIGVQINISHFAKYRISYIQSRNISNISGNIYSMAYFVSTIRIVSVSGMVILLIYAPISLFISISVAKYLFISNLLHRNNCLNFSNRQDICWARANFCSKCHILQYYTGSLNRNPNPLLLDYTNTNHIHNFMN